MPEVKLSSIKLGETSRNIEQLLVLLLPMFPVSALVVAAAMIVQHTPDKLKQDASALRFGPLTKLFYQQAVGRESSVDRPADQPATMKET